MRLSETANIGKDERFPRELGIMTSVLLMRILKCNSYYGSILECHMEF